MRGYEFKRIVETTLRKLESNVSNKKFKIAEISWADIQTACIAPSSHGFYIQLADVKDHLIIKNVLLDKYLGFVVHELLHAIYSDFKPKADTPYLAQMFNAVEDVWIERKAIKNVLLGNIENVLATTINIMIDKANDSGIDWFAPEQYPFVIACFGRHYAKDVPMAEGLEPIFTQASGMIDRCVSSNQCLDVARWIVDQLQNLDEQGNQSKPDNQGEGQGEGQGQGQPNGQSDGQGEGEGEGQEGTQDASGKPTSAQNGEGEGEVSTDNKTAPRARKPDLQKASEVEPKCKLPKGASSGGTYSKDATLARDGYHVKPSGYSTNLDVAITPKLRFEVRKLFELSGIDEYEHNHKSGRLNVSAIASIGSGNQHVFKRHREEGGIDSAVCIAVDVSTSMEGTQLVNAIRASYALLETLDQAGVATSLMTFGDETSVVKPFGQNIRKAKQNIAQIRCDGGTNDYFAIKYGHELLLNRNEQRKILFVLTDGEGAMELVRRQIKSGEVLGITTIGVGIGVDISTVYSKAITIRNANELGNASFKQIKLVA
jgi:hypothetical protein